MRRILLTGMSGTGKSTLIGEFAKLGYKAIDTDYDGLTEYAADGPEGGEWLWNEPRIQRLLDTEDSDVLFLSGTSRNQVAFYPRFDHVILLSAPAAVLIERLTTRTNNPYGKHPDELAEVLEFKETVEPLLRSGATLELDTRKPVDELVRTILAHVLP